VTGEGGGEAAEAVHCLQGGMSGLEDGDGKGMGRLGRGTMGVSAQGLGLIGLHSRFYEMMGAKRVGGLQRL